MADYQGFYEAIIDKAERWAGIYEAREALGLSEREATMLRFSVEGIAVEAEKYVPGGYHTEIFKEEA